MVMEEMRSLSQLMMPKFRYLSPIVDVLTKDFVKHVPYQRCPCCLTRFGFYQEDGLWQWLQVLLTALINMGKKETDFGCCHFRVTYMDPFDETITLQQQTEDRLRSVKDENIEGRHSDASELIPQHNYRLDIHTMNSRRPGELCNRTTFSSTKENPCLFLGYKIYPRNCREFRESVLGVMPHSWDRREDTYFQLAHFKRHKRKVLKKIKGKCSTNPFHMPIENHAPGKDSSKKISNAIGKAAKYAGTKAKKKFPYVPTITNYTQLWWVSNVIVAHQTEGIETVHLASGRTLHLTEGRLHADVNGDGVLDHVQVTAYSPGKHGEDADWRWQMLTCATWSNLASPSGMMEAVLVSTLKAFSLQSHNKQQVSHIW